MTRDPRSRRGTLAAVAAIVCAAHAVLQGIGAAIFWHPCFEEGYDSPACLWLQYESPQPLWVSLGALWFAEVGLAIAVLVAAVRAGRGAVIATAAGALVLLSNPVTDYTAAPLLNGGYASADAAPAFGYFGAALLGIAAMSYIVIAMRGAPSRI